MLRLGGWVPCPELPRGMGRNAGAALHPLSGRRDFKGADLPAPCAVISTNAGGVQSSLHPVLHRWKC